MSEEQIRPYHAKEGAHGQEAAEAVAAVLQHAAEKDRVAKSKPAPKKKPKWVLPLGINLGVLALYLLIAPPAWVVVNPIQGPDMAAQLNGTSQALYFAAQNVEAYRQQTGRLPDRLSDVPSVVGEYQYVRRGDHFQLVATVNGAPLVWDSAVPNVEIEAAMGGLKVGG